MRIVAVPTELARLRHAIRVGHPALGSSHLAEAFARGLGFGTNGAFLAWDRQRPRSEVPVRDFDPKAASDRLKAFGHAFDAIAFEVAIDLRAGRAEGTSYDTAVAMGIDAARHRQLPDQSDPQVGYLAHLLMRRANGGGGIKAFIRDHTASVRANHHVTLACAIRDAATIDPSIATFLVDSLVAGEDLSWGVRNTPFDRLWWRDLTFAAYAPRIKAFFEAMCLRSPTSFSQAVLDDRIGAAPGLHRPTEPAEPRITLDLGPSDVAGVFDAGRSIADQDTLVGAACMAMWRAGYVDEAIQSFADEAAAEPAAVLSSRFGACRENVEALKSFLVHPLDGMTNGEPPETLGIVLLREDQCAYARSRAERSSWQFWSATPANIEAVIQRRSTSYPEMLWVWVEAGTLSEHEMGVLTAASLRTTVLVTGIGPDTWERLRQLAGAAGVKSTVGFDPSAAPGPRIPPFSECMRYATFAGLDAAQTAEARDLRDTFRHYAESGAGISVRVVKSIMARLVLDADDIEHMKESCSIGRDKQAKLHHRDDARAYDEVYFALTALTFDRPVASPRP